MFSLKSEDKAVQKEIFHGDISKSFGKKA